MNEFSQRFLLWLETQHAALLSVAQRRAEADESVTLSWPGPRGALELSSSRAEITLVFGEHYHSHFERWDDRPEAEVFAAALATLEAIRREELLAAVWFSGEHPRMSRLVQRDEPIAPISDSTHVQLSYLGTYDRVVTT